MWGCEEVFGELSECADVIYASSVATFMDELVFLCEVFVWGLALCWMSAEPWAEVLGF